MWLHCYLLLCGKMRLFRELLISRQWRELSVTELILNATEVDDAALKRFLEVMRKSDQHGLVCV